ncbi:glycosyltransferase [Spirobacillus cienkowskii]|uniref:glycosyltransferase n=1 Tax=Spirobacillus cienkowskii TaxID=495820 RepID=UPI0030CC9ED7
MIINKIHYIWIGSLLPEKYIYNISYPYFNSNNEIYIWTDQPIKNEIRFRNYLRYSLNTQMKRLFFYDIKILDSYCKEILFPKLDFIERKTLVDTLILEYSFYSDRRIPQYDLAVCKRLGNLATLSDILRLIILYKEGGMYIDCDNTFRKQANYNNNLNSNRSVLKIKNTKKLEIDLPYINKLYSHQAFFGNSILASLPRSEGTLIAIRNTLKVIKDHSKYFTYKNFLRDLYIENSQYKHFLYQLLKNKNINFDSDLRRFGKFKPTMHSESKFCINMMISYIYPYVTLAIMIGPKVIANFEENYCDTLSDIFPFEPEAIINVNSDQEWL